MQSSQPHLTKLPEMSMTSFTAQCLMANNGLKLHAGAIEMDSVEGLTLPFIVHIYTLC